ncbi:MAG TPA: hypothetical protein VGR71_05925 [Nitrospira sp.]|nr:hypothetical protein [Nitrospira sp.]
MVALTLVVCTPCFTLGCSTLRRGGAPVETATVDDQTPLPAAAASIQISYAKRDDTLQSVVVSTFTGANILRRVNEGQAEASVVRFDGGVPIWKVHANRGLLPLGKTSYHVSGIEYGKVPSGFTQDVPEVGPPPPLDAGGYYIFTIERTSGAINYQAVRVKSDLSLESYDADPRAGTSYKLCCDVSSDFAEPTPDNGISPESLPTAPSSTSDQQP